MLHQSTNVRPRYLTYLCYAAMATLAIGINMLPVFLTNLSTTYGGEEGLSREALGRLGAITFAGLVSGLLLAGPAADRWGAKPILQMANLLTFLTLIAIAFAPSYLLLACAFFILGIAAGMLDMILSPIVAALNPDTRNSSLNWLHSFYCVGAIVTITAGTLALAAGLSWRQSCLIMTPLPVILLFAFAPLHFPSLISGGKRTPFAALAREPWFLAALVAICLGGATELGMAQWLPAYAEQSLGFPLWVGGASLLLFSVAMAAGRMAAGRWGHHWNPFSVMALGCGLTVILFLGGSFIPSPGWALSACIAAGFTGSALWPTMLAVTADRYPEGGATMFGVLAAMGNLGGVIMPWIVGWLADISNLHWGLASSALAPLLMIPVLLLLKRENRPQSKTSFQYNVETQ
jgi:fucose permease